MHIQSRWYSVFQHTIANAKWIEVEATVTRACHTEGCPFKETQTCPRHARKEDLGVIEFWHINPLRRLAFRAHKAFKKRFK